jgi:NAD(P)-dependent dehydrogenase (short-subunit alcohol dehydrogenase family)
MAVAMVTGAGRGLGLMFVQQLLERGDTVWATARTPERSEGLAALAEVHGDRLHTLPLDVADPLSIQEAAEAVERSVGGGLDLLVNNAGINSRGVPDGQQNVRLGSLEPQGILRMVEVNAVGPLLVSQALLPVLGEGSKVLSISSWLGSIGEKQSGGNYGYCASKTTLNMLMRAFAFDVAERGVISVVANPGWVQTDMGGSRASLTPQASVAGLLRTIDAAGPEQNGAFLQWDGSEHPW